MIETTDRAENLKVSVENFGPVVEGMFELKPLTIFIGPNNSGKSYMALLVYVLAQALSGRLHWPLSRVSGWERAFTRFEESLYAWLRSQRRKRQSSEASGLSWADLPDNLQQSLRKGRERALRLVASDIDAALREYFNCLEVRELVRISRPREPLQVRAGRGIQMEAGQLLSITVKPRQKKASVEWAFPSPQSFRISSSTIRNILEQFWAPASRSFWFQALSSSGIPMRSYYLPSARSGILQGWQAFASIAVQLVRRRVGLERVEVPPLTGVAGDFLQILLQRFLGRPSRRKTQELRPASDLIDRRVFEGQVSVEASGEQPRILYKTRRLQLPLQRASSMVAELAPLSLWIKYIVTPGDLLIIDEPEAHLHPANQRLVARVLARLVRAGVKVICTTHSPTILHQISNLLLASEASQKDLQQLGLAAKDLLTSTEVGVYLFDAREDGTHIRHVQTIPGFGIPEDEFVKVAEAIGEETYRLSTKMHDRELS